MPVFEIERGGKVYEVDAPDMKSVMSNFVQPEAAKDAAPPQQPMMVSPLREGEPVRAVPIPPQQPGKPEFMDYISASPGGRLVQGMTDPIRGAMQLAPHLAEQATSLGGYAPNPVSRTMGSAAQYMDKAIAGQEKGFQESRAKFGEDGGGIDFYRTVGNVANPVTLSTGGMATPATALGRIGAGTALGAFGGATAPVTDQDRPYWETKRNQIAAGALTGGAISGASEIASRVISPTVQPGARALMDEGVRVTPGQIKGGITKRIEDAATSIPIVGDSIRGAQRRGIEDLNRAAMNRALGEINEQLPANVPVGREGIDYVATRLGDAYTNILPRLTGHPDRQFAQDVLTLAQRAQTELPEQQANRFMQILESQVRDKMTGAGPITGDVLKGIESQLGTFSRGYSKDPNFDVRQLGEMVDDLQGTLRDMLIRVNPNAADELRAINRGWANYAIVRRAGSSLGATEGVFTPSQLSNSVRMSDSTVARGNYARGNALMQDLSDPAKATLPSSVPDSGTPLRGLVSLGVGGVIDPTLTLGATQLGTAAMYTQPGQRVMETLLARRPAGAQAIADVLLRGSRPVAIGASNPIAQYLMQPGSN